VTSTKARSRSHAPAARSVAAPPFQLPPHVARWLFPTLAVVAAILVHGTALRTFFAQDDVTFLARARGLVPTPWSLARPLSEGWTWRALHAVFGLSPLPYHLFGLLLHLSNTALVYFIGLRMIGSRAAAAGAALLFGTSSIAFTPTHWISSIVELMVATFSLASFWIWLEARERGSLGRLALAAALGLAALLSKESAILFPLVLVVAHFRLGPRAPARTLAPQALVTLAYAAALLATLRLVHYITSETYSMTGSPRFIAQNLATYLSWLIALGNPVRDAVAAMDPTAWRFGLPVAAALGFALWTQRREPRHPEEVGAVWFLVFLAPVVALRHHTYLYYLYLPWPGLCWLIASAGRRATRATLPAAAWAFAAVLALVIVSEYRNVRAREAELIGPFPRDKTIREALLLGNAVRDLRAAGIGPGDRIAFVNPAPPQHYAMTDSVLAPRKTVHSYVPLEGALRQGEAIQVFFPGVTYLGFDRVLPREWEDAKVFLFQDEGTLRAVGSGSQALSELGLFAMRIEQWADADSMFLRSRALGDTLADATYGLIITSDFVGRKDDSKRYAAEFLRRWPNDQRAPAVAQAMFPR
jgi:hypothetical protein